MSETSTDSVTFAEVNERLARIADEVRDKNLSLERSLDLYEEAVRLSNSALQLLQKLEFSAEEAKKLAELRAKKPTDTSEDNVPVEKLEGSADKENGNETDA